MQFLTGPQVLPILLLAVSNVFMTAAWYWHLRFTSFPIAGVIAISWGLALIEYCFAVPANRIGYQAYSAAELKTIQEIITLSVFVIFSIVYLKEPPTWNQLIGFVFIGIGAAFIFRSTGASVAH
ncbi:MAG: DMT family protein [Bauldia sp.]|nr:DMT family protein [Bauldia sp.]